jgi:phosphate acyltransferase
MRGKSKILKEPIAPCHIGIDLLGSEMPPKQLLEAILSFSKGLKPDVTLTLFGTSSVFGRKCPPSDHLIYHVVKDHINMEDPPLAAIRRKRDSSLCTGIRMLKEGHLQAFISAGNTGALMGCAKIELKTLTSIERPALMTLVPTTHSEIAVLDVGANTTYKASHLCQFAAMGVAYQKTRGIALPRVGLLNIGSEAKKGTPELQEVYQELLAQSTKKKPSFSFAGNIEGRDVFHGEIDVLVTDGFTGNVFLKTAEGIAAVILEQLEHSTSPLIKGILGKMRQRLHFDEYPGAILCGINGIVIKCHSNSSPQSITTSITTAQRLVKHHFLEQIRKELKK